MSKKRICLHCKYCNMLENGYLWCEMCDCNTYTTDSCACYQSNDEEGEQ